MTTTLETEFRHGGTDSLAEVARAVRVKRVRAREARSLAAACEQRARRSTTSSSMYLREARRLRREAAALDVDAALHEEAAGAAWRVFADERLAS